MLYVRLLLRESPSSSSSHEKKSRKCSYRINKCECPLFLSEFPLLSSSCSLSLSLSRLLLNVWNEKWENIHHELLLLPSYIASYRVHISQIIKKKIFCDLMFSIVLSLNLCALFFYHLEWYILEKSRKRRKEKADNEIERHRVWFYGH